MSILPISNIVNVTISNTPSGATERNVNSLAIFSNDPTTSLNPYEIYISAQQVAENYGTNSLTTKMANAIFAQVPNVRSGNGRLVIIPMIAAVSATAGRFTTGDLLANLAGIIAVSNGDIRITVDGVAYNLTNLNFTNCENFADIAEVIQNQLVAGTVEATATGLRVISKKVGSDSTVGMGAVSGGTGTNLAGSSFFNTAGGTASGGANATGETLLDAIARTKGSVGYFGVLTTLLLQNSMIETIADGIQAQDLMFHHGLSSIHDIAGVATAVQQQGNTQTRLKLHTKSFEEAQLMNAAYAGRAHCVALSGSNTAMTMNLKQLATITPDLGVSQTNWVNAEIAGIDLYVSYDGVPSVYSTGGNDFFDNIYMNFALKFAMETAGFNYLRQTNTKVPQTEQGMNGLKNAFGQVCERYIRNGFIAPGSWTSSETFGDPETFHKNILQKGYYIYSIPVTLQNPVEREARQAPLVQIAIKRAGAIHFAIVNVLIND